MAESTLPAIKPTPIRPTPVQKINRLSNTTPIEPTKNANITIMDKVQAAGVWPWLLPDISLLKAKS